MSFNDLNIREYIEKLASRSPFRRRRRFGGMRRAWCCIASMVCNLTIGKNSLNTRASLQLF